jgi:hypothetical protein
LQLVRQAFVPHTYGAHGRVVAAAQLADVPAQLLASVSIPFEHSAARHWVVGPRNVFVGHVAFVPVQVSWTSQIPLTARQTAPELPGV